MAEIVTQQKLVFILCVYRNEVHHVVTQTGGYRALLYSVSAVLPGQPASLPLPFLATSARSCSLVCQPVQVNMLNTFNSMTRLHGPGVVYLVDCMVDLRVLLRYFCEYLIKIFLIEMIELK